MTELFLVVLLVLGLESALIGGRGTDKRVTGQGDDGYSWLNAAGVSASYLSEWKMMYQIYINRYIVMER